MTALRDAQPRSADDRLLPAYRILLRIAGEKKAQRGAAAAETPPDAQKEGASPSKLAPAHDVDVHLPSTGPACMIKRGDLRATKVGRSWRVRVVDLEALVGTVPVPA